MATGKVLPYLDVPFQHSHPGCAQAHEAAGQRREEPGAHPALARGLSGDRHPQHLHRRLPGRDRGRVRAPAAVHARGAHRSRRLLCLQPGRRRARQRHPGHAARRNCAKSAGPASWPWPRKCPPPSCASASGATMQVLVDSAPALGRKGGVGRSYADAPEIDGTVKLLPPEKLSKTAEGRRIHPGAHRGHAGPRPGRRSDLNARTAEKPAKPALIESRQSRLYDWCPGRDSNPHDVTR